MDIPRYWRLKDQRYRLQGRKCKDCGNLSFPPRLVCQKCKSRKSVPHEFKGLGKLYTYTAIYQAPDRFDPMVPYIVGLIDLEEGVRITAQVTDVLPEDVVIGMDLEMVIRKIYADGDKGPILYGYKFRPILKKMTA
ncbi:MAG: Zn-ribbon domain-containing OB-fold protein [Calditrichaceae bacterium]|nr:Zn-ribbon domain-containing OB-fold protein [Calditrichaceae bacterium]